MSVVNRALNAKMASTKKKAGLGTVLGGTALGAGLGAAAGAGTAAIERPMHNIMNTNDPVTEGVGGSMVRTGKYGALAGGVTGGTLGLLAHLLSKRASHIKLAKEKKSGMGMNMINRGAKAVGGAIAKNPMAAAGAGMGYMAGGVPGAIMGGAMGHHMQGGMKPMAGGAKQMPRQAPVQPPPMQTPPMPTQAPMQQPAMQPKMGADKSLIKKAKAVLIKKAMNPLLAKALTTGAAGAGVGAVGGAIGAGEGRRTQGALRGALTGGLAGAGLELGGAGLNSAVKHLAPEGHEKIVLSLLAAARKHPNIAAAGQLAVPAGLAVAGHQAGKQEQVQAY